MIRAQSVELRVQTLPLTLGSSRLSVSCSLVHRKSRSRGYKPGRFSFNVRGGRCEACQGDGVIKVEMHFLPDVYVPCDVCKGKRYNRETLEVRYKGKTIDEVLEMTVEDARLSSSTLCLSLRVSYKHLIDVGLSYIRLGPSRDYPVRW